MFKKFVAIALALFAAASFAATDLNKATQAELESVKGLGTSTSTKLIDERQKGSFKNWGDLMQRTKGIKEARAAKLSAAGLTVNGEAFKGGTPSDKTAKNVKDKPASAKKGAKADQAQSGDTGANAKLAKK